MFNIWNLYICEKNYGLHFVTEAHIMLDKGIENIP